MESVLTSLDRIKKMSPELKAHLASILRYRKYLKREHLLRDGDVCRHIWFIQRGLVACFYEKSDRTYCGWFLKENDVAIAVASFFLQKPGYEEIVALENTEVWSITARQLDEVYEMFPEFNYHGRKIAQHYYAETEERMRAFHNQPPDEKYRYLLENYPELVNRVSVKMLASFIGVNKDTLSRVRAKV